MADYKTILDKLAETISPAYSAVKNVDPVALGRGAMQGSTWGFGDELSGLGAGLGLSGEGLIPSLVRGKGLSESWDEAKKEYRSMRDEERKKNAAAREKSPLTYTTSELVSNLLSGPGTAKGAMIVPAAAARGFATGLGVTDKEKLSDQLSDASKTAAISAALPIAAAGTARAAPHIVSAAKGAAAPVIEFGKKVQSNLPAWGKRADPTIISLLGSLAGYAKSGTPMGALLGGTLAATAKPAIRYGTAVAKTVIPPVSKFALNEGKLALQAGLEQGGGPALASSSALSVTEAQKARDAEIAAKKAEIEKSLKVGGGAGDVKMAESKQPVESEYRELPPDEEYSELPPD